MEAQKKNELLLQKIQQKINECFIDQYSFDKNFPYLIERVQKSDDLYIKEIISTIKKCIKNNKEGSENKLLALKLTTKQLLEKVMETENPNAVQFVGQKLLSRLCILAQFNKKHTQINRGELLFGEKVSLQHSGIFFQLLLECILYWSQKYSENEKGQHSIYQKEFQNLVNKGVTFPQQFTFIKLQKPQNDTLNQQNQLIATNIQNVCKQIENSIVEYKKIISDEIKIFEDENDSKEQFSNINTKLYHQLQNLNQIFTREQQNVENDQDLLVKIKECQKIGQELISAYQYFINNNQILQKFIGVIKQILLKPEQELNKDTNEMQKQNNPFEEENEEFNEKDDKQEQSDFKQFGTPPQQQDFDDLWDFDKAFFQNPDFSKNEKNTSHFYTGENDINQQKQTESNIIEKHFQTEPNNLNSFGQQNIQNIQPGKEKNEKMEFKIEDFEDASISPPESYNNKQLQQETLQKQQEFNNQQAFQQKQKQQFPHMQFQQINLFEIDKIQHEDEFNFEEDNQKQISYQGTAHSEDGDIQTAEKQEQETKDVDFFSHMRQGQILDKRIEVNEKNEQDQQVIQQMLDLNQLNVIKENQSEEEIMKSQNQSQIHVVVNQIQELQTNLEEVIKINNNLKLENQNQQQIIDKLMVEMQEYHITKSQVDENIQKLTKQLEQQRAQIMQFVEGQQEYEKRIQILLQQELQNFNMKQQKSNEKYDLLFEQFNKTLSNEQQQIKEELSQILNKQNEIDKVQKEVPQYSIQLNQEELQLLQSRIIALEDKAISLINLEELQTSINDKIKNENQKNNINFQEKISSLQEKYEYLQNRLIQAQDKVIQQKQEQVEKGTQLSYIDNKKIQENVIDDDKFQKQIPHISINANQFSQQKERKKYSKPFEIISKIQSKLSSSMQPPIQKIKDKQAEQTEKIQQQQELYKNLRQRITKNNNNLLSPQIFDSIKSNKSLSINNRAFNYIQNEQVDSTIQQKPVVQQNFGKLKSSQFVQNNRILQGFKDFHANMLQFFNTSIGNFVSDVELFKFACIQNSSLFFENQDIFIGQKNQYSYDINGLQDTLRISLFFQAKSKLLSDFQSYIEITQQKAEVLKTLPLQILHSFNQINQLNYSNSSKLLQQIQIKQLLCNK